MEANMFLIGEAIGKVNHGKLILPKEFHLKKSKLLGKWKNDNTLYISDNDKSLNYAAGKENIIIQIYVDSDDKISLPAHYEDNTVFIKGCITVVELNFRVSRD